MRDTPEPKVPELTNGRFVLRGWILADADIAVVVRAAQDPDIARYSSVGSAKTPEEAERWIRTRDVPDRLDWVITTSTQLLGRVSLAHIDSTDGVAELGYWLLPEHRGRGLASAAVGTVEQHAFGPVRLGRLTIRHESQNDRSCLLAQRRGYLTEGTARGAFVRDGQRRDLHVHALLATDSPSL
ncbi:MAG: GNAT family N-acetyltransferase [Actinomycetia bacterium]|nr:GNAT family N-acetyltransferase [Actinomycetes bacterium]